MFEKKWTVSNWFEWYQIKFVSRLLHELFARRCPCLDYRSFKGGSASGGFGLYSEAYQSISQENKNKQLHMCMKTTFKIHISVVASVPHGHNLFVLSAGAKKHTRIHRSPRQLTYTEFNTRVQTILERWAATKMDANKTDTMRVMTILFKVPPCATFAFMQRIGFLDGSLTRH